MPNALITLIDEPDGSVSIQVKFGPNGADADSAAHALAIELVTHLNEIAANGEG